MRLKHIFSKVNITNILDNFKKYFKENHFNNIVETISKFQACSNSSEGFVVWQYPKVKVLIVLKLLINVAFLLLVDTATSLIDVKHRHVLFTVPKELRVN